MVEMIGSIDGRHECVFIDHRSNLEEMVISHHSSMIIEATSNVLKLKQVMHSSQSVRCREWRNGVQNIQIDNG